MKKGDGKPEGLQIRSFKGPGRQEHKDLMFIWRTRGKLQGKRHMVAGKFWEEFRILSVSGYPKEILRSKTKSTVTEKMRQENEIHRKRNHTITGVVSINNKCK